MADAMLAPFPYFGGKRTVVADVWARLGEPKQYIEPFCGSAAMLLGAPKPASLEVVNDANGFIANFWRAVKYQSPAVAEWADYPVSHIDMGARHAWLMGQRAAIAEALHNPEWPGDAKVAGWWLWGQCAWIGSGWCEWEKASPHIGNAGRGIQAVGKVPHIGNAGRGIQAVGQVPHISNAGRGIQAVGKVPHISDAGMMTSAGRIALQWLSRLTERLERVRVLHGDWHRCLNHHYGKEATAVFFDPPYRAYESLYGVAEPVADAVAAWARDHAHLRVALCGHIGDYDLPGWEVMQWNRGRHTYSGSGTTDKEAVWFSPSCDRPGREAAQASLFGEAAA